VKFAAIDIGSNAVRLLVATIIKRNGTKTVKKESFTRVPIRLGEDVFTTGKISEKKIVELTKSIEAFKLLMEVHEVDGYRVCATSAMREAENNSLVIKEIKRKTNIEIEVIDGEVEADLIFSTFFTQKIDKKAPYLFIDVGGGSTEVTLLIKGDRIKAKSFKIGTVRLLKGKVKKEEWDKLAKWVKNTTGDHKKLIGFGTGGNINRLHKISGNKYLEPLNYSKIKEISDQLSELTYEERIEQFYLRPDRADVIVPASKIYRFIMENAGIEEMYIPKIGLSDGMILDLYKKGK